MRVEDTFTAVMPQPEYAKFNADALVRADLKSRMEAHEIAQRAGVETNDEARHVEDKAPMTDPERSQWLQTWHPAKGDGTSTRES